MGSGGTLKSLLIRIGMDTSGVAKGVQQTQGMLSGITGTGQQVNQVFGPQFRSAVTGAINSAVQFEDQLRTINTVAGLSDDALGKVGDDIQQLARDTGKSTDDLTQGFYDLVSAGIPVEKAISTLRESAKFATGGLGSVGESVDLVTSVLNAYGMSADNAGKVTDVFAKAVADGKVTVSELGGSIAQIAPIAASAGVSMEEVSAAFGIMTAKGEPARSVATKMRAAISALLVPNEALNKIQEQTGINFAALMKAEGVSVALDTLLRSVNGDTEAFGKAVGSVDAYQFALASTGENAAAFAAQVVETQGVVGLATAQYEEKSKSTLEQGRRFQAWIQTMLQDVGSLGMSFGPLIMGIQALGPAFDVALGAGKGLFGLFRRGFVSLAAAVPGLMSGVVTKITATLAGSSVAQGLVSSLTGSRAAGAVQSAGSVLGGRFGLAFKVAAIAGIALLWVEVWNQWNKFQTTVSDAQAKLQTQATGALTQSGSEAIANMEKLTGHLHDIEGFDRILADTFGGQQEVEGLRNLALAIKNEAQLTAPQIAKALDLLTLASQEALARGNTTIAAEIDAVATDLKTRTPAIAEAVNAAYGSLPSEPPKIPTIEVPAGDIIKVKEDNTLRSTLGRMATGAGRYMVNRLAKEVGEIGPSLRDAVRSARDEVQQAMQDLRWAIEHPMKRAKQIAWLEGKLTGQNLARALGSQKQSVHEEGIRTQALIIQEWEALAGKSWDYGQSVATNLARGIKNKKREPINAARDTKKAATDQLASAADAATTAGQNTASGFAAGILSNIGSVISAAQRIAQAIADNTKPGSPTKSGPLSKDGGIERWARKHVQLFNKGLSEESVDPGAIFRRVGQGPGDRQRTFAPPPGGNGRGGGDEVHIHVGTLIADDRGLDELQRRIERRRKMRSRGAMRYGDTN